MTRMISRGFIKNLKQGALEEFLLLVRKDKSLQLEIRNKYINIYYRGGNITRIREVSNHIYKISFNEKYLSNSIRNIIVSIKINILSSNSRLRLKQWIEQIPIIKDQMDQYFTDHPSEEKDYQQHVVHINNYGGPSNSTDFFICDVEYQIENKLRVDMVGLEWLSTTHNRKNGKNLRLAFIEMKFMDKALKNTSGIICHINKLFDLLSINHNKLEEIKAEMKDIFNLKKELGLIEIVNEVLSVSDEKPLYVMLFAEHDPEKSVLITELSRLVNTPKYNVLLEIFDIKIAQASYMGYGLFKNNLIDLNEWLQINSCVD